MSCPMCGYVRGGGAEHTNPGTTPDDPVILYGTAKITQALVGRYVRGAEVPDPRERIGTSCPFCGRRTATLATYRAGGDGVFFCVECGNCGARGPRSGDATHARRLWDTLVLPLGQGRRG